jgi:hypothetical protein
MYFKYLRYLVLYFAGFIISFTIVYSSYTAFDTPYYQNGKKAETAEIDSKELRFLIIIALCWPLGYYPIVRLYNPSQNKTEEDIEGDLPPPKEKRRKHYSRRERKNQRRLQLNRP